ncbi:MAG: MATE family efflux transporter [Oscillospiraceae bacterium]|nr:MATE family efflux transporter [Oscillospiraceae bacterium]
MEKHYELDMCSGPVLKKMLIFAVPLMCSSVLQLLFNAADIVVVGRFAGDASLAAVGSNTALINLLTNLFIGLSVGANVLAARHYGADEQRELSKTVHTSMLVSVFSGLILTAIGLLFAKQLLVLMKTDKEVLDLAAIYLKIYFAGMPAMMIYNFGSALLRAVGDTKRPLHYLLFAGVINVVLNLIFVIIFKMDVAGVALATVISQCVSAVLIVRCLMNEQGGMQLVFSELKFDVKKFLAIMRIGLPAGFQGVVFSLSNVVIQSSINLFGKTVVAGNSAASNIEGFIYVAMNAFHQATISFTGQNIGAGKIERINRILLTGLLCVFVTGAVLGGAVLLTGPQLLGLYSESAEVAEAGMVRLRFVLSTYFLCGMMDVMVGSIRGMGYSIMPMIVSLIGACGLRLLWIATVFQMEQFHTVETIYASYPVTWTITFLTHLICFAAVRKKLNAKPLTVSG